MSNLANEIEVTRSNIINEDFMTTICFCVIEIPRQVDIVEIVMNGHVLKKANFINKLTATELQHKAVDERPSKLYTAIQAFDIRKKRKKIGCLF